MDEIQIVFALAVLYVTYRWWSRPSTPTTGTSSSTSSSNNASSSQSAANERLNSLARDFIPPSHLAQVQSMFPQHNERDIKWEFVRGGRVKSVESVVQFLLDSPPSQPPPWFLPAVATPPPTTGTAKTKAKYPSLIERLGLQAEAAQQDKEFADSLNSQDSVSSKDKGKSTDRKVLDEWRNMSLEEKKVKLVLNARRRILEKDARATA